MGILENAKEVAKAVEGIHNLDLYQRVLSLHSDILQLVEDNNALRDEVNSLKDEIKIKGQLEHRDDDYYLKGEDGSYDGPYCTICYDWDQKLVRLKVWLTNGDKVTYRCQYCRAYRRQT